MVTHRSIRFTFCKKHVSYTCKSGELIPIGTEQLRNKRIFIYFPFCNFILIIGPFFITNLVNYYINPTFALTCAVIKIKIDSVNTFAISNTAIITERDFENEYLFRMCSVATNLMTSQEFKAILYATMLWYVRRTRNGYVATHFILLCSNEQSSATSGYVVVPERFGQNEEPASRND